MAGDRGPATEAVTVVFIVLATLFVAARFFTRIYLVRTVKQDDWWILAAWVVAVGFSTSICVGVRYGLGQHAGDRPASWDSTLRKSEYAFSVLYNPALMLTKTSILVFYLSVMSKDVDPVFKWCNWITLAVVNITGLALTFLNIVQCRPVSAGYTSPIPSTAKCTDILSLYLSSAPVNIITDIAILLLPMPILTGMRLPRKQKIILLVTFGFGLFVAVVDVIRIASLQSAAISRLQVVDNGSGDGTRIVEQTDFPWYAALSFLWSAVEVNIGIICACVPSLKPLFARFMPTFIRDAGDPRSVHGSFDESALNEKKSSSATPFASGPNSSPLNNPAAFRNPSVAEYLGDDEGDAMGFLNMLRDGPDGDTQTIRTRPSSRFSTLGRVSTNRSTVSDFGFVKMDENKNMLKLSNRQSLWPNAVVTVIFFLWGFAYGLLNVLNGRFQTIAKLSSGDSYGLHAAYYGGYLVGPLTLGRFILKRYGFKAAMMAGLCVYGCGTLVFWPSAVLTSFPAFIVSNFIVGFGLSCLEIAANPYIALCGPLEYAEVRLNLSQGFQAIGTVVSPLLATKVLFKNVLNGPSLVDVQWAYLGIAIFVFALAVVFYYIPLPEASDDELEEQADKRSAAYRAHIGPVQVIWVTLALGVFAQWCYVGAQEGVGGGVERLMTLFTPTTRLLPFDYVTIAHAVFAIGRFMSAFANYLTTPRWILMVQFAGCAIFTGVQTTVTGKAAAGVLMTTFFFESGVFSIIFAICMRGMGAHTKSASAYMTAAISGGAIVPVIQYAIGNKTSLPYSWSVLSAVFAFGCLFPIYLNLSPAARNQIDPLHEKERRRRGAVRQESYLSDPGSESRKFGLMGIVARRKKKASSDMPSAQHVERSSQESQSVQVGETITHDFGEKIGQIMSVPREVFAPHRQKLKGKLDAITSWPGMRSISESSESTESSRASSRSARGPYGITTNTEDDAFGGHMTHSPANMGSPSRSQSDEKMTTSGNEDTFDALKNAQPKREWTEKDDMIEDYHKALRGI